MISLLRMSSFFTSSPVELTSPAMPYSPAMPALRTARVMYLHESWSAFMRMVMSRSFVCSMMKRESVVCGKRPPCRKRGSFVLGGSIRGCLSSSSYLYQEVRSVSSLATSV